MPFLCGARGWMEGEVPSGGTGAARTCHCCGESALRRVDTLKPELLTCGNCCAVVLVR